MKSVCFVPIKTRSTRVPGKNFKKINGKPLYAFLLEKLKLTDFDEIYVDSDSQELESYCDKNNFKFDIEKSLKYLFYQKYLIRELSDKLNMNLTFYEELYYGDTKNTLKNSSIDLDWVDLTKFDNSRKYRGINDTSRSKQVQRFCT